MEYAPLKESWMRTSRFTTQLQVRDYECDLQGIVNNTVYQHYLENARHEYLNGLGLNFAELTTLGVIIVVIRAELDYKQAQYSG
jgi:acyl-CoA thioester hydrolase|tara:strand:- start:1313 stop:1564 length:252 start_codon:yes stop_codon:yes gene_type:complete